MQYEIVMGKDSKMVDLVNKMIKEGWTLHGDLTVTYVPGTGVLYAQAMVKHQCGMRRSK